MVLKVSQNLCYSGFDGNYPLPQHLQNTAKDTKNVLGGNLVKVFDTLLDGKEDIGLDINYSIAIETSRPQSSMLEMLVVIPDVMLQSPDEINGLYNVIWPYFKAIAPEARKRLFVVRAEAPPNIRIDIATSMYFCSKRDRAESCAMQWTSVGCIFHDSLGISQEVFFSIPYMVGALGASILCHQA